MSYSQAIADFKVVFYNVENLFDTHDDTLTQDQEFLPQSIRHWHQGRLKDKLSRLSRVIVAIGQWEPPPLVGVCEVESDRVLQQWVRYSPLASLNYRYVVTHSADIRGINVALLYQRDRFKLLKQTSYRPTATLQTRDILHVEGVTDRGDTLHVMVCHLPSRRMGTRASEPNRVAVCQLIRHKVDSLLRMIPQARIIVMGDFNDQPTSLAPYHYLAGSDRLTPASQLYNLMAPLCSDHSGSYKYQGQWLQFDQILVSYALRKSIAYNYTAPFLLTTDGKYGGLQPLRNYYGMQYQGGYSDHLPVYTILE